MPLRLLLPPLLLLGLLLSQPLIAATTPQKAANVLNQKLMLLDNMLSRSATGRKLQASGDKEIGMLLEQTRELMVIARQALQEGDAEAAGEAINGALKSFDSAKAIFNRRSASTLLERSRYSELLASIESFRGTLHGDAANNLDQQELQGLLNRANELTRSDDYAGASALLNQANQLIIGAVSSGYSTGTVVYSLDFKSPKEEYEYEVRRYQDNLQLIDTMLNRRGESPTTKLVTRYVGRAGETRQQAVLLAGNGQYQQALTTMEQAGDQLKRAMGMLGINF